MELWPKICKALLLGHEWITKSEHFQKADFAEESSWGWTRSPKDPACDKLSLLDHALSCSEWLKLIASKWKLMAEWCSGLPPHTNSWGNFSLFPFRAKITCANKQTLSKCFGSSTAYIRLLHVWVGHTDLDIWAKNTSDASGKKFHELPSPYTASLPTEHCTYNAAAELLSSMCKTLSLLGPKIVMRHWLPKLCTFKSKEAANLMKSAGEIGPSVQFANFHCLTWLSWRSCFTI